MESSPDEPHHKDLRHSSLRYSHQTNTTGLAYWLDSRYAYRRSSAILVLLLLDNSRQSFLGTEFPVQVAGLLYHLEQKIPAMVTSYIEDRQTDANLECPLLCLAPQNARTAHNHPEENTLDPYRKELFRRMSDNHCPDHINGYEASFSFMSRLSFARVSSSNAIGR